MPTNPIIIFGAGATKACDGPLTWEILPKAFELQSELWREDFFTTLEEFLVSNFHLPINITERSADHYPPLPLLISLLDTAIDKKHSFTPDWPVDKLMRVRNSLEYVIFALLEHQLRTIPRNCYRDLLEKFFQTQNYEPIIISLNYDIIVDNTLISMSEAYTPDGRSFPDYASDISTPIYQDTNKFGRLHKLHGSLNWLYCPTCNRLDVGISESGRRMSKMLNDLYIEEINQNRNLEERYSCHGSPCLDCGSFVRPVMITPTHMKDYRNPHISQIWYKADRALREADHAYIIGYSLPEDDVDVIYLLKRGLSHLDSNSITVVEYDTELRNAREHSVGKRYCNLFGDGIDWHPEGFNDWINTL